MRIFITINHPAHVYVFKKLIVDLRSRNHEVLVLASEKEGSLDLLQKFGIDYLPLGAHRTSIFAKIINYPKKWLRIFFYCIKYKPDVAIGIADFYISQIGYFLGFKSVILTDTEHVKHDKYLTFPFANFVLTPNCFNKNIGDNQVRYDSYHELAYLHDDFLPSKESVKKLNNNQKKYVLIRLVSWNALHDIGEYGLTKTFIEELIKYLAPKYEILISSEGELDPSLSKYKINIEIDEIHNFLYGASLYIGEGATMASEAAILGTPSIYLNTLNVGYLDELSELYGIVLIPRNEEEIFNMIEESSKKSEEYFKQIRQEILSKKVNLTKYLIHFLETNCLKSG